jgi:hypothetical protein
MVWRVRLAVIVFLAMAAEFGLLADNRVNAQDAATPIADVQEADSATGAATILVVDENSAPLEGVEVTLLHEQDAPRVAVTGPTGAVGFEDLPPGTYSGSVSASTRGVVDFAPFDVIADETAETTVTFPPLAELTVVVTNQSGAPVAGADIALSLNGEVPVAGTTFDDGAFVFTGLAVGSYTGSVTAPGYGQADLDPFNLENGDVLRIDVVLPPPPPGKVQFIVTGANGEALSGARIVLFDQNDNQFSASHKTDSSGKALFDGLKPSEYFATIDVDGYYRGIPQNIKVLNGQTTNVPVSLEKEPPPTTGTISVRVVIGSETVIGEGTVTLYGKTSVSQPLQNEGLAIFGNVEAGVYAIKVDMGEFGSKTIGPVQLTAGQDLAEVIDIGEPSPDNTGTAIIETYTLENYPRPLANVHVTITGDNTGYSKTLISDDQGTVVFLDIPPDHYALEAVAYDANNKPYAGEFGNFSVGAGNVVEQTLNIGNEPAPGTASLVISVTDEQGLPISGASVSVESAIDTVQLQTGPSGYAFASNVPPGTVTVSASAVGYADSAPVTGNAPEGTSTDIAIVLAPIQAPTPEPTPAPAQTPAAPVVVQLPSTGAGSGSASVPATMALALLLAAVVVLAGFAGLMRRAHRSGR